MKLFTKEINNKLFAQYPKGSDLDKQMAVAKIFNPYGKGRWFLLNSDPQDPDYIWAIVQMGDIVEMGSVSRSELESVRVSPFRLPLERDLGFSMVNAGDLYRGLLQGKFYKKGGWVDGYAHGGMVAGRWYKDNSGKEFRYIGESQGKLLFNDGEKIVEKDEDDFEEKPKERKLFGIFEHGGKLSKKDFLKKYEENEDDNLHSENVVLLAENYGTESDIRDAKTILAKHEAIGHLPTSLREERNALHDKLWSKYVQSREGGGYMEDGGFVSKTDEELKAMNDDELFAYLDAKAAYMKQYARPLSSNKAKNYAANATAIQFQKEGTDTISKNLPNFSKINEQATKDYQETIAKRLKNKMAKGGMTEHGLKVGDKIVSDQFWDKNIVVENTKTKKKAIVDLESGKRKESMAMGGKVKFQDKVKAIKASLLKRKKVAPKVQKDYGKTYSPKEAEESAKRIVGSMVKKEKMRK